jgi:hypothetical protein
VGAAGTGGRGYGRLACRRCRSTGHLREYIPFEKKRLTTGVGYSGRAALRREQYNLILMAHQILNYHTTVYVSIHWCAITNFMELRPSKLN